MKLFWFLFSINKAKEDCEAKGGSYCPNTGFGDCFFFLKEKVSTYQEASDLCSKMDSRIPRYSFKAYSSLLNCKWLKFKGWFLHY